MSDSSQGSGTPKPSAAKAPPIPPRNVNAPIRPKAAAVAPMRPRLPSSHDHSVPEARRAREPLPEDATVPMHRSDRPPSMPAEDGWNANHTDATREIAPSPKPGAVNLPAGSVATDANVLRAALIEALEPLQHALDDLTVKIARERVDRKEAIERLERTVARVATGNPPPVQAAPAAAAPAAAPVAAKAAPPPVQNTPFAPATNFAPIKSPFAESSTAPMYNPEARAAALAGEPPRQPPTQPFSVSPSANPPPVAPNEPPVAIPKAAPVPQAIATEAEKPANVAQAPAAAAAVAPVPTAAIAARAPVIVTPSTVPVKIDFDYSTDLGFELPPGLDMGKRRRRMMWFVVILVVGGAIAMLVGTLISQSRGPGAL